MLTSRILSRTPSPSPWGAPSSVDPGGLPVHVPVGGEPRVDDGKLDNQPDGLDLGLNPLESSNH